MKKKLIMLALGIVAALAAMTSTAMAHPTYSQVCSDCHSATTAITISATQIANNGVNATYQISTTGAGYAVMNGSTNLGNASAQTGTVSVPLGSSYTVWGGAPGPIARSITITPGVATSVATAKGFTNPIAYGLKSLLTTRFNAALSAPADTVKLTVPTAKGTVTLYNGAVATTATTQLASWNGLVAGAKLVAGNYKWTLSVWKGGNVSVSTGNLIISNIYIPLSVPGNGAAQSFARYMHAGATNVYVSGKTGATAGTMSIRIKGGSGAPTYSQVLTSPALLANASWVPASTWKLTLPVASTTVPATDYTVSVTSPVVSTCTLSIVQ